MPRSKSGDRLGWILVHSPKQWEGQGTPVDALKKLSKGKMPIRWHWTRSKPLKESDCDHTVLFAWEGEVFAQGVANIRHVKDPIYSFAFLVHDYREAPRRVALKDLSVPKSWRDLLVLDPRILDEYRKRSRPTRK